MFAAFLAAGCAVTRHPTRSPSPALSRPRPGDLVPWLVDSAQTDPRNVFSIDRDLIHVSGDGLGYLRTTRAFSNYVLSVQFRWGRTNFAWGERIGRARDSGIFLHATGPDGNSHDGNGAFMAAIECNLMEGACGDFLLIRGNATDGSLIAPRLTARTGPLRDPDGWPSWKPDGKPVTLERWGRVNRFCKDPHWRDVFGFHGVPSLERPPGSWNSLQILCLSNTLDVHLNGVLVNQATQVHPASGHILLQCEGSEISFRKLRIQPVSPPTSPLGTPRPARGYCVP